MSTTAIRLKKTEVECIVYVEYEHHERIEVHQAIITTGEAFTLLGTYTSNSLREELVQTIAEREEKIRNHKY